MIIYFYKLNNQQKKIKSNFQNIYYSKNIRKEGFKLNVNNFFVYSSISEIKTVSKTYLLKNCFNIK